MAVHYAESNGWHLDLLEDSRWLVSQGELRVGIFREIGEASGYYVQKSHIEKAHFGPLVAEAERQPFYYETLTRLSRSKQEEITALFERGAYWRAEDRSAARIATAKRLAIQFIDTVSQRGNYERYYAEGGPDHFRAAKLVLLSVNNKIQELASLHYCENEEWS